MTDSSGPADPVDPANPSRPVLVAYRRPGETRAGLIDASGRVVDLRVERSGGLAPGTVVSGRVLRNDTAMAAAFVEIDATVGAEAPGLLPHGSGRRRAVPHEGERLLVQIAQAPTAAKGAVLTREIALAGRYVALTPGTAGTVVPKALGGEAARRTLRRRLAALLPDGMGAVATPAALSAADSEIAADIETLAASWRAVTRTGGGTPWSPPPGWHGLAVRADAFRGAGIEPPPGMTGKPLDPDDADILDAAVEEALERRVPLSGGGTLIVDRAAALTAIDIDGTGPLAELVAAAFAEVPRQIRLRDLAGVIVVDPPRLGPARMAPLVDGLARAFADEGGRTQVHGLTAAGLVEITRARHAPPLADIVAADTLLTRGLAALWDAVREGRTAKRGTVVLPLPRPVADRLRSEAAALAEAQARFGVVVRLVDETASPM